MALAYPPADLQGTSFRVGYDRIMIFIGRHRRVYDKGQAERPRRDT
jgi:hypothetical protein